MATIKHTYDRYGNKEPAIIYLAKPGKRIYCALNGVEPSTASISLKTNNTAELTFTVNKYIDDELSNGYDYIEEAMEIYCSGIWFRISEPPTINYDGLQETKEIIAESYEIMLTQYLLNQFAINTGEPKSYEMQYQQTHDKAKFYQVKFYNKDEPALSLLDLVLSHADVPGWKIGYVDNITPDEDGVLLPNAVCNFDVDQKNVYTFLTQEVSSAFKCIFEFDTVNMLINAYRLDSFGKDTNVTIGFRNIQDSVTITRDDTLVTQFYVDGLNGYNIDSCNFNNSVIFDLSHFACEPYMPKELQLKYKAWVEFRESKRAEYIQLSKDYNDILDVQAEIDLRVPVDTIVNDWFDSTLEDLKSAYDENIAIIKGLESLYVDKEGQFDLDALKQSPDWSLYESTMNYTLPAIVAALQAKGEIIEGFGKGNVISNVNPVTLSEDWLTQGADKASFTPIDITDSPAYGITRGIEVKFNSSSEASLVHKDITVEESQEYVLSCYVKGSGTFNLEYGGTGQERIKKAFSITSSWTRVYVSFITPSKLISVAFSGDNNFSICGMQLEMGNMPSQFGYFIQDEKILKAYETNWKLYGVKELQNKLDVYEDCIDELKKNGYADPYSPLSNYKEDYHTQMHQIYLDYLNLKAECEKALEERELEYENASGENIQKKRKIIEQEVLMENFGRNGNILDITPTITNEELTFTAVATPTVDSNDVLIFPTGISTVVDDKGVLSLINSFQPFTEQEIYILKSLFSQATYTNENIIVTNLNSTSDAVDKQKRLYDAAVEELYVESHPQYIYSDTVGNIYALPEFKEFHDELEVNNFIRLGITDTKYVKLRVIEIVFNPCTLDESMEITFSNMVQYKAKRNDWNTLLGENIDRASRSGGRVSSVNKSDTAEYVITADVIKKIFSNPLFQSMIGGTTVGGAGSGGTINAEVIIAELVKAKEGIFDKLTADTAFIKYLDVTLVNADKIVTKVLEADKAKIEELAATIINAHEISADIATIKELFVNNEGVTNLHVLNLTAKNVTIDDAVIKDIIAARISVADLLTHSATAELITLISDDGKPTIAFQNSTQQFYDKDGNVRVQIGQDGTGDFNFVVRGEDGSTILLDSTGIKRDGIPDNTIITNMVDDKAITPNKVSWKIETDDNGNQITSIENVYMGNGDKFGVHYTQMIEDVNALKSGVKTISLYSDKQVFIEDNDVVTPSEIKIQALLRGGAAVSYWYIDDIEIEENRGKTSITIPSSKLNRDKKSITIKASDASGAIYDVMSLFYIVSGTDGVTVTVSSSNGTVFKDSEGIDKTELSCTVYKGAKQVIPNWYKWYKLENNTWKQIATTPTIAITVSALIHSENYKCEVDI